MRHVGAELAGRGEADERIQVRAIDVHLAAVLVHDRAKTADARLEHPVRRRIGDHDRGQVCPVRRAPSPRDRPCRRCRRRRTATDDHAHAGHLRRRRVGAVRGRGNEADVAMPLAAARVIRLDRRAARHTRPASRRWAAAIPRHTPSRRRACARDRRRSRDSPRSDPPARRDECAPNSGHVTGIISDVALSFIVHEPSGIIARSSAMSRSAQPAQVAQHLRFGVVAVERRMREERRPAPHRIRQRVSDAREERCRARLAGGRRRTRARSPRRRRASTSRRATSRACADRRDGNSFLRNGRGRRFARVASPVATTMVSKKCAVGTVWPSRSRPALRIAVRRCTRRAIVVKPGGAMVDRVLSPPSPRAGPAPCRCSTSPSRGGCAARASAARGGTPARRWRRR